MDTREIGGRPLGTSVLILVAAVVAAFFAVSFDRQENQTSPTVVVPDTGPPTPTITTDEFVAEIAAAVSDALDLPPGSEDRIVEVLTDDGQPGVIVVPSTSTTRPPPPPPPSAPRRTTTTTTTTRPEPIVSVPSVDDIIDLNSDDYVFPTTP
jgi:hypothetical protein